LVDVEAGAAHVRAAAVDAVGAVVDAEIGQQDLQQRDATPVGRVGVTDAHALGGTDGAGRATGVAPGPAAGRAGGIVFGGVGQDRQLFGELHAGMLAGAR